MKQEWYTIKRVEKEPINVLCEGWGVILVAGEALPATVALEVEGPDCESYDLDGSNKQEGNVSSIVGKGDLMVLMRSVRIVRSRDGFPIWPDSERFLPKNTANVERKIQLRSPK